MYLNPDAETQITLKNDVSVNVYISRANRKYLVWFDTAFTREEYEEYGRGSDWEETEAFCKSTHQQPWCCSSIQAVNRKLSGISKYKNVQGFSDIGSLRTTVLREV